MFRNILLHLQKPSLFCVIDGLDECDIDPLRPFISRLVDLTQGALARRFSHSS